MFFAFSQIGDWRKLKKTFYTDTLPTNDFDADKELDETKKMG